MIGLSTTPVFDEFTPSLHPICSLIDFSSISQVQKWILYLIIEKKLSRKQITNEYYQFYHSTLSAEALGTCIKRTAQSRFWEKGMSGGNDFYLCEQDMKELITNIRENARVNHAYDTTSIREDAYQLKVERNNLTVKALRMLKADKFADETEKKDIEYPCRHWVNGIIERLQSKLFYPIFIEAKRFYHVRKTKFRNSSIIVVI